MKAQYKTLAGGTGAGVAWLITDPISQAQWVIEQRQKNGRLQRRNGEGRGCGGRGCGNGDYRNMNNGGRGYARGGRKNGCY